MTQDLLTNLKTFSPRHKRYIVKVLTQIINHYGDLLLGYTIFGSYARGENNKNSDLDLLIILRKAASISKRLRDFVENIEIKHEPLAQEIFEQEDIFCELSPYILTGDEALKIHPIYYDLVKHHLIIFDPENLINRIITSTGKILTQCEAQKVRGNNSWEWQTVKLGFLGGIDL